MSKVSADQNGKATTAISYDSLLASNLYHDFYNALGILTPKYQVVVSAVSLLVGCFIKKCDEFKVSLRHLPPCQKQ